MNAPAFRPLGSCVLIKPDEIPDKIGMLFVPDQAKDTIQRERHMVKGTVIALGPGARKKDGTRWPMPDGIREGSRVLFYSQGHNPVELEGVKYVIVRDELVLAEITEE